MVVFAFAIPPSALPGISPSRGEIRCRTHSFQLEAVVEQGVRLLPISPLEGEMPGRAEGGNAAHRTANGVSPC
ncbi:diaminohydroxyphosphoribosylaminopyrimidine deaminase / 5-amino-6-(5-phosphoribosylamino)uracil reductase [Rhizobium sp. NFACC06-2]|nr:diaminohydroxyphosphoribosylaminopyrimidine deaminase / 5-amino-6-(5-phosphoribosylamino)uracil reductase [Rhizobium sp. NFACC06-2]